MAGDEWEYSSTETLQRTWPVLEFGAGEVTDLLPGSASWSRLIARGFDECPIGLAVLGSDGRALAANAALARLLGYSRDDLLEMGVGAISADGERELSQQQFAAVLRGDQDGYSVRRRYLKGNGETIWVSVNARRIDLEEPAAPLVVVSFEDISETVNLAEHMADLERLHTASIEALTQGLVIADVSGNIAVMNTAAQRILGMTSEEFARRFTSGELQFRLLDGSVLEVDPNSTVVELARRSVLEKIELDWERADGTVVPIRLSTSPLPAGAGGSFVLTLSDITTEREYQRHDEQTRAELERGRNRFAALVERAADIIAVLDAEGTVGYLSPSGVRLLGRTNGTDMGHFSTVVHADDVLEVSRVFESLRARPGSTQSLSCRILAAEGREIHVEILATNRIDDPAVDGIVCNVRDVSERVAAAAELSRQAFHDPLTGLPNRAVLMERLERVLSHRASRDTFTALCYLDLDRFKQLNDTLGHDAGDQLLRLVADRLQRSVREGDTVSRLGGDEFVILMADAHGRAAVEQVVRRVQEEVSAPVRLSQGTVSTSTSIGVVFAESHHTASTLLNDADVALYQAKRRGRNRTEFFGPEMRERVQNRTLVESQLRRALSEGSMEIFFQPVINLPTQRVVAIEALLRVPEADGSLALPPGTIEIAEDVGLIGEIGELALHRAGAALSRCRSLPGLESVALAAVNMSARNLLQDGFVDEVAATLDRWGLAGNQLVIELHDPAIFDLDSALVGAMSDLVDLGVNITVEDFGTTHLNLVNLRKLPITGLKLHPEFVVGLGHDAASLTITQSVAAIGASLGVVVIGEGVEDVDQAAMLWLSNCNFAQGHYFAPAVSEDDLPAAIARAESLGDDLRAARARLRDRGLH
jgi:diguanylate cyclase (GGDEF)-like protein/PAS domain S-box-containing protein